MDCVWLIYRKWGYAIGGNIVTRKRSLIPWGIINRLKIPNGHRHTNFMITTKRARCKQRSLHLRDSVIHPWKNRALAIH